MSKRVGPDNNTQPNNHNNHKKENHGRGRHGRKNHQHNDRDQQYTGTGYSGVSGGPPPMDYSSLARPEPVAVATPPAVPGFGFSFTSQTNGQPPYR